MPSLFAVYRNPTLLKWKLTGDNTLLQLIKLIHSSNVELFLFLNLRNKPESGVSV